MCIKGGNQGTILFFCISNNFYKDSYNVNNAANSKENVEKFMTNSSYEVKADAMLSTIQVETGEAIGIYYDETSIAANIGKGKDTYTIVESKVKYLFLLHK